MVVISLFCNDTFQTFLSTCEQLNYTPPRGAAEAKAESLEEQQELVEYDHLL